MKKTLITALTIGITFSSLSVFAYKADDVTIPSTPTITPIFHIEEHNDENNEKHSKRNIRGDREVSTTTLLTRIKASGEKLIRERLNSLNTNKQIIEGSKSLTAEQKTALITLITNNSTGLTALGVSIAAGTEASSTKALVASVYTNFRIYGIVIPQIRLQKRIYDLQNHSTKLSETFLKVQTKIDEYKGKGKDVSVWQKNLDDSKILVANNMNTLANLLTTVAALKPVNYGTSSKATIESANATLKVVLKDFNSIKKNLHKPNVLKNTPGKVGGNSTTTPTVLSGTSWVWVSKTVQGAVFPAPMGGKFVLSFSNNNRVVSTTDCNGIAGTYTLGATGTLSFGSFMATKMFCEGSQEQSYSQALSSATAYKIEGSNLSITTSTSTMIFVRK